jgi:hypothetical protein
VEGVPPGALVEPADWPLPSGDPVAGVPPPVVGILAGGVGHPCGLGSAAPPSLPGGVEGAPPDGDEDGDPEPLGDWPEGWLGGCPGDWLGDWGPEPLLPDEGEPDGGEGEGNVEGEDGDGGEDDGDPPPEGAGGIGLGSCVDELVDIAQPASVSANSAAPMAMPVIRFTRSIVLSLRKT